MLRISTLVSPAKENRRDASLAIKSYVRFLVTICVSRADSHK